MKTVRTAAGRYLAFVPRCRRCGAKATLTSNYPWARYQGDFCAACALGLIPEVVSLIGGSGFYGFDSRRFDVRCGRCGLVGEFGCRVS